jgi:hypothetical protein
MPIHHKYAYYNRLNKLLLFLKNEAEGEEKISMV